MTKPTEFHYNWRDPGLLEIRDWKTYTSSRDDRPNGSLDDYLDLGEVTEA